MGKIHKSMFEISQIGKDTREYMVNREQCLSLKLLDILVAGISFATRQFRFVRHCPNMHQILVCFRGVGEVWVDNGWRRCGSGMAYLTPAKKFCAYRGMGHRPWEVGWCIYSAFPKAGRPDRWRSITEPVLIEADPRSLEPILQGFYREASHHPNPEALEYWAGLLDLQAARILAPKAPAKLWPLWQLVQADMAYPWTLEELSKKSGLEIEQLRRVCHRETGRSPMRQVTHLRMQHALSLLAANQKIASVSDAVGYETPFAFSVAFKRTLGRSPSSFRDKLG